MAGVVVMVWELGGRHRIIVGVPYLCTPSASTDPLDGESALKVRTQLAQALCDTKEKFRDRCQDVTFARNAFNNLLRGSQYEDRV